MGVFNDYLAVKPGLISYKNKIDQKEFSLGQYVDKDGHKFGFLFNIINLVVIILILVDFSQ